MKKIVALLCAALFFILPMTAYAGGASTPTRVPNIGEAVTTYTKDDYVLDFSSAVFSVMDANGTEQSGGIQGLNNVMKIWVHTADGQTFTAYCLDMAESYPPTIAASQESMISQFPQNFTTVAWPAGASYDKMLWVVEHTYPAIPMDTMMADAGASFQRLVSEIQTNQGLGAAEAEALAESVVYATIQEAIWHHQPAAVKGADGLYIGARMLQGSQDTMLLYSYLTKDRAEYTNYSAASIGAEIAIQHPADMTPRENGGEYVFGPFSISDNMLSAGDVQLAASNAGNLAVRFTDQSGATLSSVREGVTFYVRANGVPTTPITITVQADTANAVTLEANRGRMYVPTDGSAVQPVGTGGIPKTVSASDSLTLPSINPPAPPAPTGDVVRFRKTDEESGKVLPNAVIRIDNTAGEKVWQGMTGPDGTITTDVKLLYDTDYTYCEVTPPAGYDLDSTKHTLRISSTGGNPEYWGLTNRLTVIEVPPVLADVVLKKVDADTKQALPGAKFEVRDSSGAATGVFTTGADGTVKIPQLKAGTYSYTETAAPVGYVLDKTTRQFVVSDTGVITGTTTVTNKRITANATIKKVDEQGKALAGATIIVLDSAGKEVFKGKTGSDGTATVSNLTPNAKYTYYETEAPSGYTLNDTKYAFTVDAAGKVSTLTDIVNKKTVTPTPCPTCPPCTPTLTPVIIMPPATGDRPGGVLLGVSMIAAAACACGVFLYRCRQKGTKHHGI